MKKYELSMLSLKSIDEDIEFLKDVNNGLVFSHQGKDIKLSFNVIEEGKELHKYKYTSLEYAIAELIDLSNHYYKDTHVFGPIHITIDSESINIDMVINVKHKIDQITDYISNLKHIINDRTCAIEKVNSNNEKFYVPMSVQAITLYRGSEIYAEQIDGARKTKDVYDLIKALEYYSNEGFREVLTPLPTYEIVEKLNRVIFSDIIRLSKNEPLKYIMV